MSDETKWSAVYMGWTTFKNSLDSLADDLPNVIDKSVFAGQSGSVQSQMIAGFKFLGLIGDNGQPTTDLKEIAVADEAARKRGMQRILKQRYTELFALDLTKTTAAQLYEKIGSAYNVGGDTREKAVRFFLAAVKYAELPLGRLLLQAKAATGGASRKRRNTGRSTGTGVEANDDGDEIEIPTTKGTGKTVQLKSGGTLTVSATVDMFGISAEDRAFLFGLIDKLNEYERAGQTVGAAPFGHKL